MSYDLTGLPPSPAEWMPSSAIPIRGLHEAGRRLLASPRIRRAWGRHWLDLARYSDTKGYVYGARGAYWVHAAPYRDWVIRAFNHDLPYDRFLLLQMAADQAAPDETAVWAAMGFLTLGRRFLGVTYDIIDDRIEWSPAARWG